jgi:UDP-N-acetylmuramyl pentapeptide phosphotransferase/UDP-N-acetylglucosamine-1-phosphate transferase
MSVFTLAFAASLIFNLIIIRFSHLHGRFSNDFALSGPQKFHTLPTPRIGGLAIFISLLILGIYQLILSPNSHLGLAILICSFPAFFIGLLEDLTKSISVRTRLLFCTLSAYIAILFLNLSIENVDISLIDSILIKLPIISTFFTIFCVVGLTNAYNIIDGFHGLASMVAIISLSSISFVNFQSNDFAISSLALIMAGSCLGFFIINYPKGLIFLGDGGSYLIGFSIATLSILTVNRHENISPWFCILINAYPIFETLFSIYRRKVHKNKSPSDPDGIHFHSLIYRRIVKHKKSNFLDSNLSKNAKTAPYFWVFSALPALLGVIFMDFTSILILITSIFFISYIWLYGRIISFRTPRWLFF